MFFNNLCYWNISGYCMRMNISSEMKILKFCITSCDAKHLYTTPYRVVLSMHFCIKKCRYWMSNICCHFFRHRCWVASQYTRFILRYEPQWDRDWIAFAISNCKNDSFNEVNDSVLEANVRDVIVCGIL